MFLLLFGIASLCVAIKQNMWYVVHSPLAMGSTISDGSIGLMLCDYNTSLIEYYVVYLMEINCHAIVDVLCSILYYNSNSLCRGIVHHQLGTAVSTVSKEDTSNHKNTYTILLWWGSLSVHHFTLFCGWHCVSHCVAVCICTGLQFSLLLSQINSSTTNKATYGYMLHTHSHSWWSVASI